MNNPLGSQLRIFFFLIFLSLPLSVFGAVSSEDCLGCHDGYKNIKHGSLPCTDCHADVVSLPHKEKLATPSCGNCHQGIAKTHASSIHGTRKIDCKSCHNAHYTDKGRKTCADCHKNIVHRSLPSKEKHLEALPCAACHGTAKTSVIKVKVHVSDKGNIQKGTVDLDGDGKIDAHEWDNFQALLSEKAKGKYATSKEYAIDTDTHGVTKNPLSCKSCHIDRKLFGQARLLFTGASRFEMPIEPSVFIPATPSIDSYRRTVHGRKGVQCNHCHVSRSRISDSVCIQCHKDVYGVYKHTVHAQKGATKCTDCHNPHRIEAYKELAARERLAICSRCHKDYVLKHRWLPSPIPHFEHLECSTCHSPESTKSMVFFLSTKRNEKKESLNYATLQEFYGKNVRITPMVDKDGNELMDSQELAELFTDVRKRLAGNAFIGSSIVVTRVHHDYSAKAQKERICTTCHSDKAPFYESMFFVLPEDGYHMYVPVKGTILSATPVSVFIDMSLLGGQKARWSDVKGFFQLKRGEFTRYSMELGFKWIDLIGIGLSFVIFFFVLIHIAARVWLKK